MSKWVGVFSFSYFSWKKHKVFGLFFYKSLVIRGNDFYFFKYLKSKHSACRTAIVPKIDTLAILTSEICAILGVDKVVFWTFSKFFKTCFESVWALYLA